MARQAKWHPQNPVHDVMRGYAIQIADLNDEMTALQGMAGGGKYSREYIDGAIDPAERAVKAEMRELNENGRAAAKEAAQKLADAQRQETGLDSSKLTDDMRLLGTGLLSEADYVSLMRRNEGNATMERLIARDAEKAGVRFSDASLRLKASELDGAAEAVESTLRDNLAFVDRFFGQGHDSIVGNGYALEMLAARYGEDDPELAGLGFTTTGDVIQDMRIRESLEKAATDRAEARL